MPTYFRPNALASPAADPVDPADMDDDDEDLYGPSTNEAPKASPSNGSAHIKPEPEAEAASEDGEEGEEEGDDEESDSDIEIITDRPQGAEKATPPPSKIDRSIPIKHERTISATDTPNKRQKTQHTPSQSTGPSQPPPPSRSGPAPPERLGTEYPEVRTSNVDLDAEPLYDSTGKPISSVDIDADLANHSKPWRLPGADQSDYFNYGFDEYTWVQYCIKQGKMRSEIKVMGEEKANLDKMLAGGMAGGVDGGGMMNPEMMQQMMAQMMGGGGGGGAEGMDYAQMMGMAGGAGGANPGNIGMYGANPAAMGMGMDGGQNVPSAPQNHGGPGNFGGRGRGRGRRY